MRNVSRDRILLLFIYLVAFGTGFFIGNSYTEMPLLGKTFLMILPATIVIWLFSFLLNNSSVFDPYWSVAPAVTFGFFWWQILPVPGWTAAPLFSVARNVIVFLLLLVYGTRLTWNFLRGWKGLKQEDWRYAEIRKKTGVLYWTASLVGIHLFPALLVFAGCLSLFVVATRGNSPGFLDILGILVTGNAIWLEATADRQLRNFIRDNPGSGTTLKSGLWSVSRHPNYLGEISFWWGLYFFALAADPSGWWAVIGPAAITLMFVFISIPMMEKRLMERREDYKSYREQVSCLLPFRFRRPS